MWILLSRVIRRRCNPHVWVVRIYWREPAVVGCEYVDHRREHQTDSHLWRYTSTARSSTSHDVVTFSQDGGRLYPPQPQIVQCIVSTSFGTSTEHLCPMSAIYVVSCQFESGWVSDIEEELTPLSLCISWSLLPRFVASIL